MNALICQLLNLGSSKPIQFFSEVEMVPRENRKQMSDSMTYDNLVADNKETGYFHYNFL